MELSLIKQPDNRFALAYDSDHEKAMRIKIGEVYKCTITKPRNYEHHKKYFALMKMVFENQEHYTNMDQMRKDITKVAGFVNTHVNFLGETVIEAQSINFASMDQFTFNELYERTKDVICIHFRLTNELIEENIHQYY